MNPYEASTALPLEELSGKSIDWRVLLIAVLICFGVGCIVGVGFGIIAFIFVFAMGPSAAAGIDIPVLMVAGFVMGLIPFVFGAFYLGRNIETRWLLHAVIYSIVNILISVVFMLIPSASETIWTDIVYCVLLIPISIGCVSFAARTR